MKLAAGETDYLATYRGKKANERQDHMVLILVCLFFWP